MPARQIIFDVKTFPKDLKKMEIPVAAGCRQAR